MSGPIIVEIDQRPVVLILAAAAVFQLTVPPPVHPNLTLLPNPIISVNIPAPVQPIVELVTQQIVMEVNLATGGIRGLQGERGATFLGGYPSLINLPPIDGINVKDGDFALVNDTSTVYQIRP